ncbi:MAG: rod shape-determining protein RodA [Thermoanaerobaculia bacterium]|nr:rod shape-determining protein RodA [Thermoanaerobaculia bacterium]
MRSTSTIASLSPLPDERLAFRSLANVRWGLLVAALLLSLIGLATVHSASLELQVDYLPRQSVRLAIALVACAIALSVDYQLLTKFALPIYLTSLVLLVVVLFAGRQAGGARSWLEIGAAQLQPSDFAKLATTLMLARYLANVNRRYLGVRQILAAGGLTAAPMVLVALEPDLGGAAMFVPILGVMLLVCGVRWRFVLGAAIAVLLVGTGLWFFVMMDYQRQRVQTYFSPESEPLGAGYQLRQSKIAVGSGQLDGRGYLQGTQSQLRFLPARHTDFIFAVLAEEWGFLGVATVLVLYAAFFLNGIKVAMRGRDRAGILLVMGLMAGIGFHVLYNTAMVVGLVPITGIPLPFLSYGGSFTVANFVATGMILGVDFRRYVNR